MRTFVTPELHRSSSSSADALALLAAGTAHELNNPLAVIVGYLSLLLSGKTPADRVQDQLLKMQAEAKHCRLVLDGLTRLAEATTGARVALDLAALLEAALSKREDLPSELDVQVSLDGSLLVDAHERGLAQLLRELLLNVVGAGARSLRITGTSQGAWVRLTFADDGVGIASADLARAKHPFFSATPGRLGLGLTLAELVASANGGSLELASTSGHGTVVTLMLPNREATSR